MGRKNRRRKIQLDPPSFGGEKAEARITALYEASLPSTPVDDEEERPDRRKYPRLVKQNDGGRIGTAHEASVLNISLGGALVEHAYIVRPGTISSLVLNVPGRAMKLSCRIVRSSVHRLAVQPDGEGEVIYHTGLEFVDSSEEAHQIMSDFVQSKTIPSSIFVTFSEIAAA